MGRHVAVTRRWTVFEYRYYKRLVIALWITARRYIKARLRRA
jgi:hypothetical protein